MFDFYIGDNNVVCFVIVFKGMFVCLVIVVFFLFFNVIISDVFILVLSVIKKYYKINGGMVICGIGVMVMFIVSGDLFQDKVLCEFVYCFCKVILNGDQIYLEWVFDEEVFVVEWEGGFVFLMNVVLFSFLDNVIIYSFMVGIFGELKGLYQVVFDVFSVFGV